MQTRMTTQLESIVTTNPQSWLVAADLLDECGVEHRFREIAEASISNQGVRARAMLGGDDVLSKCIWWHWWLITELAVRWSGLGSRWDGSQTFRSAYAALKALSDAMIETEKTEFAK